MSIDEALAVHVDDEVGRLVPHEARVEVVHDAAVSHGLHAAAGLDGKDVAVAGAVDDFLVELLDVRAEAADHGGVVFIGAGREDDGLGIELDVVAVEILADTADDGTVGVFDELDNRRAEVNLQLVTVLLLRVLEDAGDERAVVAGLGAEPGGEDLDLFIAEVIGLGTVVPDAGVDGGGVLILGDAVLVFPLGLFGDAALLADELQSLFGALDIGLEQLAVVAPAVDGGGEGQPFLEAALGGAGLDDGGGAVALGHGNRFLLQHSDRRAELGCAHRGDDTGSAGAGDDHIDIDFLGKAGDGVKLNCGGIHIVGGDVLEDECAVRRDLRLDGAGVDSFALGLCNAVFEGRLYGGAGDGGAGDAVDLGTLGGHNLADELILGGLSDAGGLAGHIQQNLGDAVFVKGRCHGDGAHTVGGGGVGAGGVDSGSVGGVLHGAETDAGHGEGSSTREGTLKEISSAQFRHEYTLLYLKFLWFTI